MARNPIQRQSVFDKPGRWHGGVVVQPAPRARVGAPQRCEGATVPGITRLSQLRRWLLGTWRKRGKVVKIHHFSAIGSTHMALLQWQLAFHPTCTAFQSHHFYCILYFFVKGFKFRYSIEVCAPDVSIQHVVKFLQPGFRVLTRKSQQRERER